MKKLILGLLILSNLYVSVNFFNAGEFFDTVYADQNVIVDSSKEKTSNYYEPVNVEIIYFDGDMNYYC